MEPTVYPIVEKYLKEQGKKVEELADEIGTSRSTMYYKLNGGSEVSIDDMPTIDPESLRPHGHWIRIEHDSGQVGYKCSCCGSKWPVYAQFFAYCAYCGAKNGGRKS